MPRFWLLEYPCPMCYPDTMWKVSELANPARLIQEGQLYFKFDYSCIKCRKDRPNKISWVIRRFRARAGWRLEGEGLLEDPSPPLWTCKACYPGPTGMWKKRKPDLPSVPESEDDDPNLTCQSTPREGNNATLAPAPASVSVDKDGEQADRRHAYRADPTPEWLTRVDTSLNDVEDETDSSVEE